MGLEIWLRAGNFGSVGELVCLQFGWVGHLVGDMIGLEWVGNLFGLEIKLCWIFGWIGYLVSW